MFVVGDRPSIYELLHNISNLVYATIFLHILQHLQFTSRFLTPADITRFL